MKNLIRKINDLKNSEISETIASRIGQFKNIQDKELFNELCFCLMTANFRADKCIEIQKEINKGFHNLTEKELAKSLKEKGHRFWPQRAERIVKAREHKNYLTDLRKKEPTEARDWLVKNIKGLGMKESSHFLRNIGFKDLAIIDFHIIDLMEKENLIERPKNLNHKTYLEIEAILKNLSKNLSMNLAELDLYLWYIETNKILK